MKRTVLLGTFLLLAAVRLLAATPGATEAPVPFEARYELRANGIVVGERTLRLGRDGAGDFRLEALTEPRGLGKLFHARNLREFSRFRIEAGRLRPLEYDYRREGRKPRHVHLLFDWDAHRVTNDIDGNRWQMSIPEGTLDKLLVQLAIARDLASGDREAYRYAIADGGKLKTFRFVIEGSETIETPAGRFATVKLLRKRHDHDRTTRLWCADRLGYLPVRILQDEHEDAVRFESLLTRHVQGDRMSP